ncbi:MAG: glycine betaine ABC transporter substrate-binding protein, partial [Candidatus Limnocylindrales bacterium]
MRTIRRAALGAAMLALIVSACSLGGGSQVPTGTIASQLTLAGPAECPERPFCLKGLTDKYGLTFKEFKPTDTGGPITISALENGDAQIGLLFTSDPVIAVKGFILLQDDKQLQLADNLVPVVRQAALDANPVIGDALN